MRGLLLGLAVAVVVVLAAAFYMNARSNERAAIYQAEVDGHIAAEAAKAQARADSLAALKREGDFISKQGEFKPETAKILPPKVNDSLTAPREDDGRTARLNIQYAAENAIRAVLKDESAARFEDQNGFCGRVNSKNSFGAYTGFRRYAFNGAMVVIEGENMTAAEMDKVWAKICA